MLSEIFILHGNVYFLIYLKPPTLLTNLQRGNTQTQIHQLYVGSDITFHTLAGQGELMPDHMHSGKLYSVYFILKFIRTELLSSQMLIFMYIVGSIDVTDDKGLTGLMWAAGYGQLGSAKQLLKWGADVNCRGPKSETTLHLAAAYGHHDLVKLLLNHGADPNACDEVHILSLFFQIRTPSIKHDNYFCSNIGW